MRLVTCSAEASEGGTGDMLVGVVEAADRSGSLCKKTGW